MRALIVAASLFVPVPAYALEIGARLPTRHGEVIVVKNDGGVKNWTTYFPYGSICHTDLNLKTWLIVKRIVGEQTLLVVDFGVESTRLSCPHGTETNTPYAQARTRYEDYVRALDDKFFSEKSTSPVCPRSDCRGVARHCRRRATSFSRFLAGTPTIRASTWSPLRIQRQVPEL